MDLNLFNKLENNNKNDNLVDEFLNELNNFIEKNFSKNDFSNSNISILEQVQKEQKITAMFRDKMYIERNNILNNYASKTSDKGEMYYIYSVDEKYNLFKCEEGESHNIIEVDKEEIPSEAKIDSALRIKDEKYVIDEEATKCILEEISEMIDKLLKEQDEYLDSNRIEGHIYEVGEIEKDRVWLYDTSLDDTNGVDAIEEINFPQDLLDKVTEGEMVKYENGEYVTVQ